MVVIIGGGITGAATAYYLSQQQQTQQQPITIIDAVGPAACSKAAAFVSGSWGDGTKTEKLHRKAFELHLELADELSLQSFREIPACHGDLENWEGICGDSSFPAKPGRHALVDPEELVTALIEKSNAKVEINSVSGFQMDESARACGILMENGNTKKVLGDEPIVVATGPWASRLEDWMDKPIPIPIDGVLSTSIVWQNYNAFDTPMALFCEEDTRGCHLEIFQRVDDSLYVSGLGSSKPLKAATFRGPNRPIPGQEQPARPNAAIQSLQDAKLLNENAPTGNVRACIRPMSPDGIPVAGKLSGNVYVATGGGQWGITWGPLLGQTIASLLSGQVPPMSKPLRPGRFDTAVQRAVLERRSKDAWKD